MMGGGTGEGGRDRRRSENRLSHPNGLTDFPLILNTKVLLLLVVTLLDLQCYATCCSHADAVYIDIKTID